MKHNRRGESANVHFDHQTQREVIEMQGVAKSKSAARTTLPRAFKRRKVRPLQRIAAMTGTLVLVHHAPIARASVGDAPIIAARIRASEIKAEQNASTLQPKSEAEKRRELLRKLGLEQKKDKDKKPGDEAGDGAPPQAPEDPPPSDPSPTNPSPTNPSNDNEDVDDPPDQTGGSDQGTESNARTPPRITYLPRVHRMLEAKCEGCHRTDRSAGKTRYQVTGNDDSDYQSARRLVDLQHPDKSPLIRKALGRTHGGGKTLAENSSEHKLLLDWVRDGARKGRSSAATSTAPATPSIATIQPSSSPSAPANSASSSKNTTATKAPRSTSAPTASNPPPKSQTESPSQPPQKPVALPPAIHASLLTHCQACHGEGQGFALLGDPVADADSVRAWSNPDDPDASVILLRAQGDAHPGGPVLSKESAELVALRDWIAQQSTPTHPDSSDAESSVSSTPSATDTLTGETSGPTQPGSKQSSESFAKKHPHGGIALPGNLILSGKFDVSYERNDFKNRAFSDDSTQSIQSYHHFLFLQRSDSKDPFSFDAELLTLAFFRASARLTPRKRPYSVHLSVGKLVVPFGPEPIFHSSYGGRAGFDQRILTPIWSQYGIQTAGHWRLGAVTLRETVYLVQGFALPSESDQLSLQQHFSRGNELRLGIGQRLGASIGPVNAWYSTYFNQLGFDQRLLLQAIDLELWRPTHLPVLKDLSASIGALRADVSGLGAGSDYYHFGSYFSLTYRPWRWMNLQYRNGLATFDNRRGVYFDERRVDQMDASSHNITIEGRYRGAYARLQMFWNLEKANEIDDDRLRFTLGFEF